MPTTVDLPSPVQTLENLNAIFSSVAEGIVMQAATGAIVECNASAERVLGLSRDQMMGRTSVDPRWRALRDDGSDFPGTEHPAMVALSTGQPVRDVIMGVHKPDGTLSWISITAVPILEDGKAVRAVTTFADVTARRNAEIEAERLRLEIDQSQRMLAAIREVQARFIANEDHQLVFDRILSDLLSLSGSTSGFIGEVLHDTDSGPRLALYATTHAFWSETTGVPPAPGRTSTELVRVTSLVNRTVASGETVIAHVPAVTSFYANAPVPSLTVDAYLGLPLCVGTELVGVIGLANRPGGYDDAFVTRLSPYVATCSQIVHATREQRERDQVERALAVQRERMTLVLEASGIGHWDWNPTTDEAMFDDRWVGMLGYQPGDIEGSGAQWLRLLHPDDLPATVALVERHMKGESPEHRAEFRMRHRDGTWVWILAVGRVIERDASGQVTRMVGVHVDISARKEYETALAQATGDAQRANRAKSDFLANMSHEIRTPMNGVIGAANLLLFTDLSDEQREYSDTIRRSGEILLSLIDDILDLSKIEADRLELDHIAFDPRETIAEVAELESVRAAAKRLDLIVDWRSRPLSRMEGDPKRLQQVLLNLVSNAIKFTSHGHIVITAERTGEAELRLSVTDTGIGIPFDKQDLIFDKFMQADTSTTRRFGGTGLGLAISRRLVEAMGGTIGVRSVPGAGSTFWFTLPLAPSSWAESAADPVLRDAKVLILDADQISRDALSRLLEQHGARMHGAASSDLGLATLRQAADAGGRFDLVVAAFAPERFELRGFLLALETDPRLNGTAVLVTVAGNRRTEVQRALAGTHGEIMRKPITRPSHAVAQCAKAIATARARRSDRAGLAVGGAALPTVPNVGGAPAPPRHHRLRVLLAEDNDVSRLVAQRMLEKQNCDVEIAEDGRRAVALTAEKPFDLVFMDCNMPEMDGFEAAAAIRARGRDAAAATDPAVPIIALTASVLAGDRERCLAAGMVDYVTKPLLSEAVARVLERWRPTPARTTQPDGSES